MPIKEGFKINKRQFDIFTFFIEHHDEYISSTILANKMNVSIRTIKSELPDIRKLCESFSSFNFLTTSGKGYKLKVIDQELFISEIIAFTKEHETRKHHEEGERDLLVLKYLLNSFTSVSKNTLLEHFYISESTWYKTYNNIKKLIKPFNLEIVIDKNSRYKIIGLEKDIRSLIAKYELSTHCPNLTPINNDVSTIYNFTADTFLYYQYNVREEILQNISSHIMLMIERTKQGNIVEQSDIQNLDERIEYKIAEVICHKFIDNHNLNDLQMKNEILLLTQTILGKISYSIDEKVQHDINEFIAVSFEKINKKFNINFEPIEKLRLFLVLHMIPLVYRLKSGTQLRNLMTRDIQQQFPHVYDISLYFSILFKEKFNLEISMDELSYITLYFNFGMEELQLAKSNKELLIITDLRPSETVLLRHKLLSWFPNQTIHITFADPTEKDINMEPFDAVLATQLYDERYANAITLINVFPDNSDFNRINLALNGFNSVESIINKFNKHCFFHGEVSSKKEIIQILCDNARHEYKLNNDFVDKILLRETFSSTCFNDFIAIPHPLAPESEETFVSIGILKKPLPWDDYHNVKIVMLISIEKNNPKAFQFWHYISDLVRDETLINELISKTTFDDFIHSISKHLSSNF